MVTEKRSVGAFTCYCNAWYNSALSPFLMEHPCLSRADLAPSALGRPKHANSEDNVCLGVLRGSYNDGRPI
jgi:hypothetical protein